jgi:hypothetical protein
MNMLWALAVIWRKLRSTSFWAVGAVPYLEAQYSAQAKGRQSGELGASTLAMHVSFS